jgi:hypothetical protein
MLNIQNVIEKKGGEIRYGHPSGATCRWRMAGATPVCEFSYCDSQWEADENMTSDDCEVLVSATEEVVRAEERARFVEIECPAYCCIDGKDCDPGLPEPERGMIDCESCGGSGKLYRKQDCLVSTEVKE